MTSRRLSLTDWCVVLMFRVVPFSINIHIPHSKYYVLVVGEKLNCISNITHENHHQFELLPWTLREFTFCMRNYHMTKIYYIWNSLVMIWTPGSCVQTGNLFVFVFTRDHSALVASNKVCEYQALSICVFTHIATYCTVTTTHRYHYNETIDNDHTIHHINHIHIVTNGTISMHHRLAHCLALSMYM